MKLGRVETVPKFAGIQDGTHFGCLEFTTNSRAEAVLASISAVRSLTLKTTRRD